MRVGNDRYCYFFIPFEMYFIRLLCIFFDPIYFLSISFVITTFSISVFTRYGWIIKIWHLRIIRSCYLHCWHSTRKVVICFSSENTRIILLDERYWCDWKKQIGKYCALHSSLLHLFPSLEWSSIRSFLSPLSDPGFNFLFKKIIKNKTQFKQSSLCLQHPHRFLCNFWFWSWGMPNESQFQSLFILKNRLDH